jgi:hypothetical protein
LQDALNVGMVDWPTKVPGNLPQTHVGTILGIDDDLEQFRLTNVAFCWKNSIGHGTNTLLSSVR